MSDFLFLLHGATLALAWFLGAPIYAVAAFAVVGALGLPRWIVNFLRKRRMKKFLEEFAKTIPDDVHVAMLLDQAGWHGAKTLRVPDKVTLVPLPPYSPELNPVERVWLYLRERYLSFRLHANIAAVEDAACRAWNALRAEVGRITTLTSYAWIKQAMAGQVNG